MSRTVTTKGKRVWFLLETQRTHEVRNAAPKARDDLDVIFDKMGLTPLPLEASTIDRRESSTLKKLAAHITASRQWSSAFNKLDRGDAILIQFPPRNHSVLLPILFKDLRRRGVSVILIIHDLDYMRFRKADKIPFYSKVRTYIEETSLLKCATSIICHNSVMREILSRELGIDAKVVVTLDIFDYLMNDNQNIDRCGLEFPVLIAGNLGIDKAGYIYDLPDDVCFRLFGLHVREDLLKENCSYGGSFQPDVLPPDFKGCFGLVWDGPSSDTCSGYYGEYLRVNNPHKTSLFLAAGIPIIVWEEAAIAQFVLSNGLGKTVPSLGSISSLLNSITVEEYHEMCTNVARVSSQLKSGYYTKNAVSKSLELIAK